MNLKNLQNQNQHLNGERGKKKRQEWPRQEQPDVLAERVFFVDSSGHIEKGESKTEKGRLLLQSIATLEANARAKHKDAGLSGDEIDKQVQRDIKTGLSVDLKLGRVSLEGLRFLARERPDLGEVVESLIKEHNLENNNVGK